MEISYPWSRLTFDKVVLCVTYDDLVIHALAILTAHLRADVSKLRGGKVVGNAGWGGGWRVGLGFAAVWCRCLVARIGGW